MADLPLLIFPEATFTERHKKSPGFSRVHKPTFRRQVERLSPQFDRFRAAIEAERMDLSSTLEGIDPERAIVLEIAGTVEKFANAVARVEGLEWLAELTRSVEPDDDFYDSDSKGRRKDREVEDRLFVLMSDQRAARELVSLWRQYQEEEGKPKYAYGWSKWREVFDQLRDVRFWGPQDRLEETGLRGDWEERLREGEETIRLEIELWFRAQSSRRSTAERHAVRILQAASGELISRCEIESIRYHALLADLPISQFEAVIENFDAELVRCEDVMFLRPQGQVLVEPLAAEEMPDEPAGEPSDAPLPGGEPIVALLDGLPLENHPVLRGRLRIDDPEGWAETYPQAERLHGTAMASLIVHGELDGAVEATPRPVYARPLMRPDPEAFERPFPERMPRDRLIVDFVHQAVRRIFEDDGAEPAASPGVRIINLSMGDPTRLFFRTMSPWARLLDSLAFRYRVLFIVSAGNHRRIPLSIPARELDGLIADDRLEQQTLRDLEAATRDRRLLSPAESINALTIGALHGDLSPEEPLRSDDHLDVYSSSMRLPAPYSALGSGFRRAVKPDLLFPGGRQRYRKPWTKGGPCDLEPLRSIRPPGQRVALPGRALGKTGYLRGTSNAAVLATRSAARLVELIDVLREEPGGESLGENLVAVIAKALLVHGSSWSRRGLDTALRRLLGRKLAKGDFARFLGYGVPDIDRVLSCTDYRATLLGCSSIGHDGGHEYRLPLPPSLSGRRGLRRVTVTLAWLTPINSAHQGYRRASLWFELRGQEQRETKVKDLLQIDRREADWQGVRRGTVQHEIFEGDRAAPFAEDDEGHIQVNCRADAGKLNETVPYALAVTFEVAESVDIPVYDEIKERLRIPVRPIPGAS